MFALYVDTGAIAEHGAESYDGRRRRFARLSTLDKATRARRVRRARVVFEWQNRQRRAA